MRDGSRAEHGPGTPSRQRHRQPLRRAAAGAHAADGDLAEAELLLLDEHTAALDPKSADQVITLTETIVARDQLTTLMVTHSMQQAATIGDRLIMMHRGSVIHDFRGAEKRGCEWRT